MGATRLVRQTPQWQSRQRKRPTFPGRAERAHRAGASDLRKREAPEVASLQNVYTAFVAKKNVLLVLQRMLIDCPEAVPQPIMI
jgi:hypothetical protein